MFTIITSEKKGSKFHFKKFKLNYVQQNDVKFCVVSLKKNRKVDWNKIEKVLGDTKTRTILFDDVQVPSNIGVTTVDYTSYSHLITINAVEEILCFNQEYIRNKSATLVDIGARHQNYADVLVRYFGVVRIITNKLELYKHYKNARLYEMGATVLVSNKLVNTASDNTLFVSPDGIVLPSMIGQSIPTLSSLPIKAETLSPIYHSFRAKTPKEYLLAIENTKTFTTGKTSTLELSDSFYHSYQAALYEYCGLRLLSRMNSEYGYLNSNKKTLEEIKFNIFTIDTK